MNKDTFLAVAFGSLLSVKWLIGAGWLAICIQLFRHDFLERGRVVRVAVSSVASCLIGVALLVGWYHVHKPPEPLTIKDVRDVLHQELPNPQSGSTASPPRSNTENTRPTTKAELADAVREALKQMKPSSPSDENFANLTGAQLNEDAKSTVNEIVSWVGKWQEFIGQTDKNTFDDMQFFKRTPDGRDWIPMNAEEARAHQEKQEQNKTAYGNEVRSKTRNLMARACGIRTEIIVNRFTKNELNTLPQDKAIDELCGRIQLVNYGQAEMGKLAQNLSQLQKRLEVDLTHWIRRIDDSPLPAILRLHQGLREEAQSASHLSRDR